MKKFKALMIVGGILLVIGLYVAVSSVYRSPTTITFEIPVGEENYNYVELGLFSGAQLACEFTSNSGPVDVRLFDEAQYRAYQWDGSGTGIANATGGSASFAVTISKGGKYYITIDHGTGQAGSTQTGRLTYKITGTDVTMLAIGAVLLLIGVIMIAVGLQMKKKEVVPQPYLPPSAQGTGIIRFDEKKTPPEMPKK